MCLLAICMSSLGKCLFRSSAIFQSGCLFFWCWVIWAVYICWILTPYLSYHLQIFFPIKYIVFFLSMVFFAVQKLLNLIRSHLYIFAFISFALGDRFKKILLWFMSKSVLPMFSSRRAWVPVLHLGLNPFWVYVLHGVRECSNYILLHIAPVFPAPLIEETVFSPLLYILASFAVD